MQNFNVPFVWIQPLLCHACYYKNLCNAYLKSMISNAIFSTFPFFLLPGLICEPTHFHSVNNVEALKKHFKDDCSSTGSSVNHLYPARHFRLKTCYMQDEKMLFSCAGESENLQRLCPCRTFINDQSALCQSCL